MARLRKGILVAGALCAAAAAQGQISGYGLRFDGTSGHVNCGTAGALNFGGTAPMTIEAWVRTGPLVSPGPHRTIISKFDLNVAGAWLMTVDGAGKAAFSREVAPYFVSGTTTLPLHEWHHVAAVHDGATTSIYVDGVLEASAPRGSSATAPATNALIGARMQNGIPQEFFNGTIDDLRVWDYALSAAEIETTMNAPLDVIPAALAGYWPMDELVNLGIAGDGGDDIRDRTSRGNHGDLVGGVELVTSDLMVSVESKLLPLDPATTFNYDISVRNAGPMRATATRATITFPPQVSFVSTTLEPSEFSVGAESFVAQLGDLADGDEAGFELRLRGAAPEDIAVGVVVDQAEPDMNPLDNAHFDGLRGSPPIELGLLGKAYPGFRVDGDFGLLGEFAISVSGAGDVNGDGMADIVLGRAPLEGLSNAQDGATVVFGKRDGASVDVFDSSGLSGRGIRILGPDSDGHAGRSVSGAGDVNGDGFADVVIGAQGRVPPTTGQAGEAFVVFGKPDSNDVDLGDLGEEGFAVRGPGGSLVGAGYAVSGAGDVNGDGMADILVLAAGNPKGTVFVVFGKQGSATINLASLGSGGFRIDNTPGIPIFTQCVSGAGDVNGDGLDDVIVGLPFEEVDGAVQAGRACVVFGKVDSASVDLDALGSNGFAIEGTSEGDMMGRSVSGAGDVNGDGLADVVVGSSSADTDGAENAGLACVVFGKADNARVDVSSLGTGGFRFAGVAENDSLGASVANAGDFDGDGFGDLLVGASDADGWGLDRAGRCHVVFGRAQASDVDLSSPSSQWLGIDGINLVGRLGLAVSTAGDVDGDGRADLLLSEPQKDRCYVALNAMEAPLQASWRATARAGNAPASSVGTAANGSDDDSPSSRCWIDFADGSGPGNAGASMQTVTLVRSGASIAGLPHAASVLWRVESDRGGWTSAKVTLKYTAAEAASLGEHRLSIYRADNPAGPWTLVPGSVHDTARNRVSGTVETFGYFAIGRETLPGADDVMVLTEFGDVWYADSAGGGFAAPVRMRTTGFAHDVAHDQVTMFADVDGDGLADALHVTDGGELWTAINQQNGSLGPSVRNSSGWSPDKNPAVAQHVALDFNGDGMADLVEARDNTLRIGINTMGAIGAPVDVAIPDFDVQSTLFVSAGDFNGDGFDDLFALDSRFGSMGAAFGSAAPGSVLPVLIGNGGPFRHDPAGNKSIAIGDFNGDGKDDVAFVQDSYALNVQVALMNASGTALLAPAAWTTDLGFHDDPSRGTGWWVFAGDFDGDGADDLLQNTGYRDNWIAFSNGADGFAAAFRAGAFGFQHTPQGPWKIGIGKAAN